MGFINYANTKKESMEEFVKDVFQEWVEEFIYDDTGIHELIDNISIIEIEFGT